MKRTINLSLITLLIFIFYNSLQCGYISTNSSDLFVDKLLFINPFNNIKYFELFIRKLAHFIEYFTLGSLIFYAHKYNTVNNKILYILLFTGIFDELLQYIPINRSPSIFDMFLDTISLFIGIYLSKFIYKLYLQFVKNHLKSFMNE